jgi:hypothetical protein
LEFIKSKTKKEKEIYMSGVEIRLRCTTVPSNFIFPWNKRSFFFLLFLARDLFL